MSSVVIPAVPRPARPERPVRVAEQGRPVRVARQGRPARSGASISQGVTPGRAVFRRRRVVALAVLVLVAFLLTVAIGRVTAEAELADKVAGHVVIEPGSTLWDVAVATAPDGVDPRRQLAELRALNGISGSQVDAWTVVMVPAR